eukprot:gene23117-biopygen19311
MYIFRGRPPPKWVPSNFLLPCAARAPARPAGRGGGGGWDSGPPDLLEEDDDDDDDDGYREYGKYMEWEVCDGAVLVTVEEACVFLWCCRASDACRGGGGQGTLQEGYYVVKYPTFVILWKRGIYCCSHCNTHILDKSRGNGALWPEGWRGCRGEAGEQGDANKPPPLPKLRLVPASIRIMCACVRGHWSAKRGKRPTVERLMGAADEQLDAHERGAVRRLRCASRTTQCVRWGHHAALRAAPLQQPTYCRGLALRLADDALCLSLKLVPSIVLLKNVLSTATVSRWNHRDIICPKSRSIRPVRGCARELGEAGASASGAAAPPARAAPGTRTLLKIPPTPTDPTSRPDPLEGWGGIPPTLRIDQVDPMDPTTDPVVLCDVMPRGPPRSAGKRAADAGRGQCHPPPRPRSRRGGRGDGSLIPPPPCTLTNPTTHGMTPRRRRRAGRGALDRVRGGGGGRGRGGCWCPKRWWATRTPLWQWLLSVPQFILASSRTNGDPSERRHPTSASPSFPCSVRCSSPKGGNGGVSGRVLHHGIRGNGRADASRTRHQPLPPPPARPASQNDGAPCRGRNDVARVRSAPATRQGATESGFPTDFGSFFAVEPCSLGVPECRGPLNSRWNPPPWAKICIPTLKMAAGDLRTPGADLRTPPPPSTRCRPLRAGRSPAPAIPLCLAGAAGLNGWKGWSAAPQLPLTGCCGAKKCRYRCRSCIALLLSAPHHSASYGVVLFFT